MKRLLTLSAFFFFAFFIEAEEPWSIDARHPVTKDALFINNDSNNPPPPLFSDWWITYYSKYMNPLDFGECAKVPANQVYFKYILRHYNAFRAGLMFTDRVIRCSAFKDGKQKLEYDPPVFVFE